MNPEIIKTTSVVEKKFTYPNGCYILYTLKDNELYSYSMMKGIYHYNYYLKDLSEIKELADYKAINYLDARRLSFTTEKEILDFNDFNSLYCMPENVIKNINDEYLNFHKDLKGSYYYISHFRPTKKSVELFSEYLKNSPYIQLCSDLEINPVPHYNQDSYHKFTQYHISKGLIKFVDDVFVKSIRNKQSTFYTHTNDLLRQIEELFVKEHEDLLEELFKKELENLF